MKKIKIIFVLLLIFVLISTAVVYNFHNNIDTKTRLTDQEFLTNLSLASSGFAKDYSNMDDNEKIANYIDISSNLYTAMNILDMTSYSHNKNRNELFTAIYNLYNCMTRKDSRDAVLTNRTMEIVNKCLNDLTLNPKDEKACQTISKLAGDLYFKQIK